MLKWIKENYKILVVLIFEFILLLLILNFANKQYTENKAIETVARIELEPYATPACAKYCEIKVIKFFQNFVLLELTAGKDCSGDQIYMVMKKNEDGWKFAEIGLLWEFDSLIPKELFDGVK